VHIRQLRKGVALEMNEQTKRERMCESRKMEEMSCEMLRKTAQNKLQKKNQAIRLSRTNSIKSRINQR